MLQTGDEAIDFTKPSTSGTFTLSERVKDGPVLIYFYVVNFGMTCTEYMEKMNERLDDFKGRGVTLCHLNPDSVENHLDWIRHTDCRYEIISDIDQEVSRAYDCIVTKARNDKLIGKTNRAFILIDRDMKIRYCWRADMPTDTVPMDELFASIDAALSD